MIEPAFVAPLSIADCRLPIAGLREADLHTLWLEQRFPPGVLVTVAGEPVCVHYRGRPGGSAGPDFRDARVSIGGGPPRLGDIELHVTAADFRRHGHAIDPAYGRVVLHVVFDARGEAATTLPSGGVAPVLALRSWVERRSAEIEAWLRRHEAWREPCHSAVDRLGIEAVRSVLREGGERRLRHKAAALWIELAAGAPEQVLYRALCGALGLSRNVDAFRMLADRLPLRELSAEVADLPDDAALRHLGRRLRAIAGLEATAPVLGALPWRLDGLRPNAHPAKRIDALAALLVRHRATGLEPALRAAAGEGAPALLHALHVPGIGRDRAVEIAVNGVLPFLVATGAETDALAVAAALPAAAPYGNLAPLTAALVHQPRRPSLVMAGALAQQGALALHRDWCRRGGCGICPLSGRMKAEG